MSAWDPLRPYRESWPWRQKVVEALRRHGCDARAARVEACCASGEVRVVPGAPQSARLVPYRCDDRECRLCHEHRTRGTRRRLEAAMLGARDRGRRVRMITLPLAGQWGPEDLAEALRVYGDAIRRWWRHPETRRRVSGCMASVEYPWTASQRWHVHAHILAEGRIGPRGGDLGWWPVGRWTADGSPSPDTRCGDRHRGRLGWCARCAGQPMDSRGCGRSYGLRDVWRQATSAALAAAGRVAESTSAAMVAAGEDDPSSVVDIREVTDPAGSRWEVTKYALKEASTDRSVLGFAAAVPRVQRYRWMGSWRRIRVPAPSAPPGEVRIRLPELLRGRLVPIARVAQDPDAWDALQAVLDDPRWVGAVQGALLRGERRREAVAERRREARDLRRRIRCQGPAVPSRAGPHARGDARARAGPGAPSVPG